MDPVRARELEAFGVVNSKFGTVTLLRLIGTEAGRPCLGFLKRLDEPDFEISGWSCQGDTLPARRAAIRCMLNGLILLTARNDPKLAELFARAELKRPDCASPSAPAFVGGLGDRQWEPTPWRRAMMVILRQGTGLDATFALMPALSGAVWRI